MDNNKNKKSVKFEGDVLNFCDFIQVFVFTRNHHLKNGRLRRQKRIYVSCTNLFVNKLAFGSTEKHTYLTFGNTK